MSRITTNELAKGLDALGKRLDAFGERLGAEIRSVREDLGKEIRSVRQDLGAEIQTNRRRSEVLNEELRSEIRLVADGLQGHREETAREFKAVRAELSETRAEFRLWFSDLDRRIRS